MDDRVLALDQAADREVVGKHGNTSLNYTAPLGSGDSAGRGSVQPTKRVVAQLARRDSTEERRLRGGSKKKTRER